MFISGEKIKEMGLVKDYESDSQFQPNGVDLRLDKIYYFVENNGFLYKDSRRLSDKRLLKPSILYGKNVFILKKGVYTFTTMETIYIPPGVCTFIKPRSTLIRSGVSIESGLGDSGWTGKWSGLLVVHIENYKFEHHVPIAQLVFLKGDVSNKLYNGIYMNDGIEKDIPEK